MQIRNIFDRNGVLVAQALLLLYVLLVVWWSWINLGGLRETIQNYTFGGAYALIGVTGGSFGLFFAAASWGGWRSVMGRAVIFLALGLLGQSFGQLVWTYYNTILQVEVPYPSVADIGYFALIPFNALAMWYLARAAGVRFSFQRSWVWAPVIGVPLVMLAVSYVLFLRDYEFDPSSPLRVFLDFGYPTGEAIVISLAILTFILTRNFLGGVMRWRVLYIVFAFVVQYITDYTFLYHDSREIYYNAGPVDLMYMTSFLIMSLGLLALRYQAVVQGEPVKTEL